MLAHVDNRITYSGNGNATEFAYQFKILDRTDIKVLLTDADGKEKLLTKDYYVDVEKNVVRYPGYAVGAEVPESERPPVLPAGWKLTIYREVPVTQETDLPDQYPFNQVEDIGDKLTMIAQQLTDVTSRSLKISVSKSADIDATIPWENGKSFRISDDGAKIELTEDPARVLPLAQGVYAQAQAQAQSAYASAAAAAQSEDSAAASASEAGNSAQSASTSAASAAESAELTSGYKQEALTAKNAAATSATNAKASEANAKTSENNAEASKEAAQSAATTASNFASAARNSAGEAKTYKDNAKTYMDNAELYMNNAKNYSENVNVFIPSVSAAGVLSWTNRAGLDNPASVNIKGAKGDKGDTGNAATIEVGTVTTGAAGSSASVINRGDANNAILDFILPKGADGKGSVITVNGKEPDANGNVEVSTIDVSSIVDIIYPVGSLYWSKNPTNPATLFGGTWTQIKDKFILAAGDSYAQGATGGASTVTLTTAQMPMHTHGASTNTTGAHSHTRGTMEITGSMAWSNLTSLQGAFYQGQYQNSYGVANAHNDWKGIAFAASRSWSGSTSYNGDHSHTVTVNNSGNGESHENMPPYVTYYCWERTA